MNFYESGWTTNGKEFDEMCDFCKNQRKKEQKLSDSDTICRYLMNKNNRNYVFSAQDWFYREQNENQWFPVVNAKKCTSEFPESWNTIDDFSVVSSHGKFGDKKNSMSSPNLKLAADTYSQTVKLYCENPLMLKN